MKKHFSLLTGVLLALSACGTEQNNESSKQNDSKYYAKNDITFNAPSDERTIFAESYIPKGNNDKLPTFIFSHGYKSNYSAGLNYAKYLAYNGCATILYDFCGGSTNSKSDGNFEDMTCDTEIADLKEVYNYVQTLDFVDTSKIYLIGESMGGFVSALFTSFNNIDVQGLILLWPALCIPDDAYSGNGTQETSEKYQQAATQYYGKMDEIVANVTENVLLFHGTADEIVDIKYSDYYSEVFTNCTYYQLEGAGHGGLNKEHLSFVEEKILEFVK